jgi:hypothetical protein
MINVFKLKFNDKLIEVEHSEIKSVHNSDNVW